MNHKRAINPADLDVEVSHGTMAGAISDIIWRFGDGEFTSAHILKVINTRPEYKAMRGREWMASAIRHKIQQMARSGRLERVGKYDGSRFTAYRKIQK